jgi:hypothetical protein
MVCGCATKEGGETGEENKRLDKASAVRLPAAGASLELGKTPGWSPPVLGGE